MAARDARLPLLLAFAGSLMLAVSHDLARSVLAAVLLLPLALWRWRGQQRALLRRLVPANILLLFMLLLLAVDISAWSLSPAGLDLGLLALARANGAMLLCAIALRRQNADSLAAGIAALTRSDKLALVAFLMIRYLEDIRQVRLRLERVLAARGFRFRGDRHSYRTLGLLLAHLFLDGLDRATAIARAMQARAYRGRFLVRAGAGPARRDGLLAALALMGLALLLWMPL
ncbi:CbiQ family ECF transporter T component [Alcaligenes sp. Marseille-Q7550]